MLSDAYAIDCGLLTVGLPAYSERVTFGKRVVARRKDKGWTQKELARRTDLDSQTIFRIEHDRVQAGWQSRLKLSRAFGISVAELTGEEPTDAETLSPFAALASLSEKALLDGLVAVVRELERRGLRPDPPSSPAPVAQSPARPRRRR